MELDRFIKMKIDEAQKIPEDGFYYVCKDRYWAVIENNIFFFRSYTSPQCKDYL